MLAVQHEQRREEWLRAAALAVMVRRTIWGKDSATPYQLLGWPDPEENKAPKTAAQWRQAFRDVWTGLGGDPHALKRSH